MGRGFVFVSLSGAIWILSGFLVHIALGRWLGPKAYGTFGIINAVLAGTYLILGSGFKKAVTKHISSIPAEAGAILRTGLWAQGVLSWAMAAAVWLAAPALSSRLNDPHLMALLRWAALIIPLGGVAHLYSGYFDGCRQFSRSAAVAITNSVLKVIGVYAFLKIGYELPGAVLALGAAMAGATCLAVYLGRGLKAAGRFSWRVLTRFAVPALAFALRSALLSYLDLFFVKYLLADADKTGYYTSAQTVARLVNFALLPFGVILLPAVSKAMARNDLKLTQRYIRYSLRYILMALIIIVTGLGVYAEPLIRLIYGEAYVPGAPALEILFIGTAGLGLSNAMVAILQGSGTPRIPALIFMCLVPLHVLLNLLLIPLWGIEGAAWSSSATFLAGLIILGFFLYHRFAVLVAPKTVAKILVSAAAMAFVLLKLPLAPILLPANLIFGTLIFVLSLCLLRELKGEDWSFARNTIQNLVTFKTPDHPGGSET